VRIQIIDFQADFCMHEKCMMLLYLTFIYFVDIWAQNIDFGYFCVIIHLLKVNSVSLFSFHRKHSQTHNKQNINQIPMLLYLTFIYFVDIWAQIRFWLLFRYHTLAKIKFCQSLFLQSQTLSDTQQTKYQPTPFNFYKNLFV
jgi:hypothetical protein